MRFAVAKLSNFSLHVRAKASLLLLGCALLLGITSQARAEQLAAKPVDVGSQYVGAHQLVDLGEGRKLNLFCMGSGEPTVLFDSGLSDWSVIWALVQPAVAKRFTACSYDRAGMGYSGANAAPRSPIAVVEDMHRLVHVSGLRTPLILVGHSLGGFNMKLYAALYPKDVAGLVLVDPSEDRSFARTRSFLTKRFGARVTAKLQLLDLSAEREAISHYDECAGIAQVHDLDPLSDFYKKCTDPVRAPLGPAIAAERARLQVSYSYQQTQASELANSVYGDERGDAAYAMLFTPGMLGKRPLIVLTHGIYDKKDLIDSAEFAQWNELHNQTARLSSRGINRIIPGTHHNIEVDKPEAITQAIFEVIRQTQRDSRTH